MCQDDIEADFIDDDSRHCVTPVPNITYSHHCHSTLHARYL